MREFYITIARKIFFRNFVALPCPVSYATTFCTLTVIEISQRCLSSKDRPIWHPLKTFKVEYTKSGVFCHQQLRRS